MIALLLALAGTPAPAAQTTPTAEAAQATLQSCELTPQGWVCHYKMPPVILKGDGQGGATVVQPPPAPVVLPLETTKPVVVDSSREARLIAKCADAPWYAVCLPGERREAKLLKEAADARIALRREVTGLLSEGRCDEAVKKALAGGDLALAREAREFCATAPKS